MDKRVRKTVLFLVALIAFMIALAMVLLYLLTHGRLR